MKEGLDLKTEEMEGVMNGHIKTLLYNYDMEEYDRIMTLSLTKKLVYINDNIKLLMKELNN